MTFEPFAFQVRAIGVARTPFKEKIDAPRQAPLAAEVEATIELHPGHGYEDALDGLATFSHVWIVFAFHLNTEHGWNPKVLPPRAKEKVGVFASRSPHRPNPIGMTAARLVAVEGRTLRVRGIDLLDGTPILDIKPYIAYADAIPEASEGWLAKDPEPAWTVEWSARANEQVEWLAQAEDGVSLKGEIESRLALGPQPHAYRRIKNVGGRTQLAWKEWRSFFAAAPTERTITVEEIVSGYRPAQIENGAAPKVHAAFTSRFSGR